MPLGTLKQNRRIDLRPYVLLRHRVLYVSRPSVKKVWISLRSLPSSVCATAAQMLDFLQHNPMCAHIPVYFQRNLVTLVPTQTIFITTSNYRTFLASSPEHALPAFQ